MHPSLEYRFFYKRHLPHFQPAGATLFITFRLAGSIPVEVMEQLLEGARKVETELDKMTDDTQRSQ